LEFRFQFTVKHRWQVIPAAVCRCLLFAQLALHYEAYESVE